MRKRKPLLLIVSAVLLLTTVLAACSNSNTNNSQESPSPSSASATPGNTGGDTKPVSDTWVFGSEPLEFSLYFHYGWVDYKGMDDYPATKWLKENKQLNITPIQANGSHSEKMTTMISGNMLPDVIWGNRFDADIDRLYEAGQLVAFDEYLEKYPNLLKWAGKEKLDLLRSPDGKLYKFPNWYTNSSTNTAGYAINKKIYRELGSPKLETLDDLYAYLVKVKEKYGDQVIPFETDRAEDGQGVAILYTAFKEGALYDSLGKQLLAVPNGDKLTSVFTDPTFRESQKFVNKLYREKLMTQDAFTQTDDMVLEKLMTGRVAVYASANVTDKANKAHLELSKTNPEDGYFVTWPFHKAGLDKNKIHPGGNDRLGWNVAVITKAAKDPEKIFAFLDWYTSPEGMNLQFFGPEGKNWKGFDENGYPIFTEQADPAEIAQIQTDNLDIMLVGNAAYIDPAKISFEKTLPEEKKNWQAKYQSEVTWPSGVDITEYKNLTPPADSELGTTQQHVENLFLQVFAETTQAKSEADIDKILDQAEKDAQSYGYNKLLEWRTEQWQEKRKILGLE
ncbi:extracellular solute-binding protein [Paenibacillus nanensis]|uniref:Extracellular solute-binding protein n=1 Tax=Paenibacillus nanensis TaxID=393251 RepID=A0A3A1UYD7_9BACL|nr:extracellular solute-binding protein [Paenibacillus nanensis]RIX52471.1 extracellular solute-binding protein [Paenibacillus nanensis]